jgi:hypothetical protein
LKGKGLPSSSSRLVMHLLKKPWQRAIRAA